VVAIKNEKNIQKRLKYKRTLVLKEKLIMLNKAL